MLFYICPKDKKIQDIRENFFAYVNDTFEFTIFTVYVEKKKWNYLKQSVFAYNFEIERMQESTQDNAQVNGDRYL